VGAAIKRQEVMVTAMKKRIVQISEFDVRVQTVQEEILIDSSDWEFRMCHVL